MTRFNRTAGDVVKQTVVGITLGEYVIGLVGVLLAHAVDTADIVAIVTSTVGFVGMLIVIIGHAEDQRLEPLLARRSAS